MERVIASTGQQYLKIKSILRAENYKKAAFFLSNLQKIQAQLRRIGYFKNVGPQKIFSNQPLSCTILGKFSKDLREGSICPI